MHEAELAICCKRSGGSRSDPSRLHGDEVQTFKNGTTQDPRLPGAESGIWTFECGEMERQQTACGLHRRLVQHKYEPQTAGEVAEKGRSAHHSNGIAPIDGWQHDYVRETPKDSETMRFLVELTHRNCFRLEQPVESR